MSLKLSEDSVTQNISKFVFGISLFQFNQTIAEQFRKITKPTRTHKKKPVFSKCNLRLAELDQVLVCGPRVKAANVKVGFT